MSDWLYALLLLAGTLVVAAVVMVAAMVAGSWGLW